MTNSSSHDLQWRHPFSVDLKDFILLKITASVYAPIHFVYALHVYAKYFLDVVQTIMLRMVSCFQKYIL